MLLNIKTTSRAIERFLKTDTAYLARGGAWLSVGKIIRVGAAFLLSILYARYLYKSTYGDYRYIFSLIGLASILTFPDIGNVIIRGVARGFAGTFRRGALIIFLGTMAMAVLGIGASFLFFYMGNLPVAYGLLTAALLVPLMEGIGSWRAYYDGTKEFRKKTGYNFVIQILYVISMAIVVTSIYFFKIPNMYAVALLVGTYLSAQGIPNIFILRKILKEIPKKTPVEPGAIRYGFHLSLNNIPTNIATYLDTILLYHFLGPTGVAVYSFAIAIPEQMKAFFGTIAAAGLPKISEKTGVEELGEVRKSLPKKILKSSLFTGIIVLIYIAVAPIIYSVFFPRYLESTALSQIFALSLVTFPFAFFGTALMAEGNIKKVYAYRILTPVVQIVAFIVLIPLYGLLGAVAGRVMGRLAQHLLLYIIYII